MNPRIEVSKEKKLAGKRLTMSFADFQVEKLWKSFMPLKGKISNPVTDELISMTIYQPAHFSDFNPPRTFQKSAALDVSDFENIPAGMETYLLSSGLYAIFMYKGSSTDHSVFQYIFETWLPNSDYILDDRPHIEVLGEKYRNNDSDSEEEIWIPIKKCKS